MYPKHTARFNRSPCIKNFNFEHFYQIEILAWTLFAGAFPFISSLPSISLPSVSLPSVALPSVTLPSISLPVPLPGVLPLLLPLPHPLLNHHLYTLPKYYKIMPFTLFVNWIQSLATPVVIFFSLFFSILSCAVSKVSSQYLYFSSRVLPLYPSPSSLRC